MRLPIWFAVLIAPILMALTWTGLAQAATVGFQTASVPVAGDRPLPVAIWYPSTAPEKAEPLALGEQRVARDGPIAAGRHPLIVISHGTGGSNADHFDTARALAAAGFVVAAPTHTGDTQGDRSRSMRITERSGHLSAAIDYMTGAWRDRAAIDPARIGVFGFSAGGFTALVAIGGAPDTSLLERHCAVHPHFFDCQLVRQFAAPQDAAVTATPVHDPRIRAAVVAAPALGFTFAPKGLANVSVPVQLWRAEWDTVLPQPFYAETVRGLLPKPPEYHVVPGADHFDFLPPCSAALAKAAPSICGAGIFDRTAFHKTFNSEVVRFFRKTLG